MAVVQYTFTHTNNTQNNTIDTNNTQKGTYITIRIRNIQNETKAYKT